MASSMKSLPRRSARRGSAAIEFALCLLFVLMPMVGATVEWGFYFYREITVQNVARDAVRVGVADVVDSDSRETAAQHFAQARLEDLGFTVTGSNLTVTTTDTTTVTSGATSSTFNMLKLSIAMDYSPILLEMPSFVAPPSQLQAVYEMRRPD